VIAYGAELDEWLQGGPKEAKLEIPDRRLSRSVAVLPFVNMTSDTDLEYFCDGLTEEIINALAQVSGLQVVARTSAFSFKNSDRDIREIGELLGAGAVVEGSVREVDDQLRITAQFIDTSSGLHVWSRRFDIRFEDVFEVQDEISLAIVETLEVDCLGSERARVTKRPTDNLEAYNAALKGRFHWHSLTPEGYVLSKQYFDEAIGLDPELVWAYNGIMAWHLTQTFWGELPPEAMLAVVNPIVRRVDTFDESHIALGMSAYMKSMFGWQWDEADRDFLRARELAPNAVEVHLNYALTLLLRERFDEARRTIRLGLKLDPVSPLFTSFLTTWLAHAGEIDEAREGLHEVVEMHPHHWMPRFGMSVVEFKAHRLAESRTHAEAAVEMSGGLSRPMADLACVCYLMNDTNRGDELDGILRKRAAESYVPPTLLGWIHLVRGEEEEALVQFEEGLRRKDGHILTHRVDSPVPLPDDDRFSAISRSLDLPV
jgi:serine/threonine-protein kinase